MNYVTPSKVKHSKIKIKEQKIQKKKPREKVFVNMHEKEKNSIDGDMTPIEYRITITEPIENKITNHHK